jgi:chromosome segregation ATPase
MNKNELFEVEHELQQLVIEAGQETSEYNTKATNLKNLVGEEIEIKKLIDDNIREINNKKLELEKLSRVVVQSKDRLRQIVQEIPRLKSETDTLKRKLDKFNVDKRRLETKKRDLELKEKNRIVAEQKKPGSFGVNRMM